MKHIRLARPLDDFAGVVPPVHAKNDDSVAAARTRALTGDFVGFH
jgi:hypothetical protein